MLTPYISYGFVSTHLENTADFSKASFYQQSFEPRHATAHIQKRCARVAPLQDEFNS